MTTTDFRDRLLFTTLIAPIGIIWLSPLRIEHTTSVDSAGTVTEVTTIIVDYWGYKAAPEEAAPEGDEPEAVSQTQTQ